MDAAVANTHTRDARKVRRGGIFRKGAHKLRAGYPRPQAAHARDAGAPAHSKTSRIALRVLRTRAVSQAPLAARIPMRIAQSPTAPQSNHRRRLEIITQGASKQSIRAPQKSPRAAGGFEAAGPEAAPKPPVSAVFEAADFGAPSRASRPTGSLQVHCGGSKPGPLGPTRPRPPARHRPGRRRVGGTHACTAAAPRQRAPVQAQRPAVARELAVCPRQSLGLDSDRLPTAARRSPPTSSRLADSVGPAHPAPPRPRTSPEFPPKAAAAAAACRRVETLRPRAPHPFPREARRGATTSSTRTRRRRSKELLSCRYPFNVQHASTLTSRRPTEVPLIRSRLACWRRGGEGGAGTARQELPPPAGRGAGSRRT